MPSMQRMGTPGRINLEISVLVRENVHTGVIMNFHDQNRQCHPERSEGSLCLAKSDPSLRSG